MNDGMLSQSHTGESQDDSNPRSFRSTGPILGLYRPLPLDFPQFVTDSPPIAMEQCVRSVEVQSWTRWFTPAIQQYYTQNEAQFHQLTGINPQFFQEQHESYRGRKATQVVPSTLTSSRGSGSQGTRNTKPLEKDILDFFTGSDDLTFENWSDPLPLPKPFSDELMVDQVKNVEQFSLDGLQQSIDLQRDRLLEQLKGHQSSPTPEIVIPSPDLQAIFGSSPRLFHDLTADQQTTIIGIWNLFQTFSAYSSFEYENVCPGTLFTLDNISLALSTPHQTLLCDLICSTLLRVATALPGYRIRQLIRDSFQNYVTSYHEGVAFPTTFTSSSSSPNNSDDDNDSSETSISGSTAVTPVTWQEVLRRRISAVRLYKLGARAIIAADLIERAIPLWCIRNGNIIPETFYDVTAILRTKGFYSLPLDKKIDLANLMLQWALASKYIRSAVDGFIDVADFGRKYLLKIKSDFTSIYKYIRESTTLERIDSLLDNVYVINKESTSGGDTPSSVDDDPQQGPSLVLPQPSETKDSLAFRLAPYLKWNNPLYKIRNDFIYRNHPELAQRMSTTPSNLHPADAAEAPRLSLIQQHPLNLAPSFIKQLTTQLNNALKRVESQQVVYAQLHAKRAQIELPIRRQFLGFDRYWNQYYMLGGSIGYICMKRGGYNIGAKEKIRVRDDKSINQEQEVLRQSLRELEEQQQQAETTDVSPEVSTFDDAYVLLSDGQRYNLVSAQGQQPSSTPDVKQEMSDGDEAKYTINGVTLSKQAALNSIRSQIEYGACELPLTQPSLVEIAQNPYSKGGWFVFSDMSSIINLLTWLNPEGQREGSLLITLMKYFNSVFDAYGISKPEEFTDSVLEQIHKEHELPERLKTWKFQHSEEYNEETSDPEYYLNLPRLLQFAVMCYDTRLTGKSCTAETGEVFSLPIVPPGKLSSPVIPQPLLERQRQQQELWKGDFEAIPKPVNKDTPVEGLPIQPPLSIVTVEDCLNCTHSPSFDDLLYLTKPRLRASQLLPDEFRTVRCSLCLLLFKPETQFHCDVCHRNFPYAPEANTAHHEECTQLSIRRNDEREQMLLRQTHLRVVESTIGNPPVNSGIYVTVVEPEANDDTRDSGKAVSTETNVSTTHDVPDTCEDGNPTDTTTGDDDTDIADNEQQTVRVQLLEQYLEQVEVNKLRDWFPYYLYRYPLHDYPKEIKMMKFLLNDIALAMRYEALSRDHLRQITTDLLYSSSIYEIQRNAGRFQRAIESKWLRASFDSSAWTKTLESATSYAQVLLTIFDLDRFIIYTEEEYALVHTRYTGRKSGTGASSRSYHVSYNDEDDDEEEEAQPEEEEDDMSEFLLPADHVPRTQRDGNQKKRGRPKASPNPDDGDDEIITIDNDEDDAQPDAPKKKRGRPPRQPPVSTEEST